MFLPILAAVFLGNPSKVHKGVGPEIFVQTGPSVSVERLAAAVCPMGSIESRKRGTRLYLIQLNAGVDDEMAKRRLERIPGVHALEAADEPVDMTSVRSINRKIDHLEAEAAREQEEAKKDVDRDGGADYLKAYRYFIDGRSYPNDSFDWGILDRARNHAEHMPKAKFRQNVPGADPSSMVQNWTFAGPTNLKAGNSIDFGQGTNTGRVNAVAFDPNNSQTIYAGAAAGGLWKSTNSGTTWTWLSSSWPQLDVNCIAVDPADTDIIYVGLGDYQGGYVNSFGIMKTIDGGQTWNEVFTSATQNVVGVDSILIDPTNHQTIVAGTGDGNTQGILWVSNNAGQSWNPVLGIGNYTPAGSFPSVVASVPNGNNVTFYSVLAGGAFYDNGGDPVGSSIIVSSKDHGASWQIVNSLISNAGNNAYTLAASPTNPNNLYVLDSQDTKLYATYNGGSTWTDLSANLPLGGTQGTTQNYNFSQSGYDYYLGCGNRVVDGKNTDILFLSEIDIQQSADQGKTWQSIGGPSWLEPSQGGITHNDQHCFALCPTNPNLFLFGNDGGIYSLSYNTTKSDYTVTALNSNLSATMFYKLACHPTNPNIVMGGTQDNGTPLSPGDLGNWVNPGNGDGGSCVINQANPLISYLSSEGLDIWRTSDGWKSSGGMSPPIPKSEHAPFVCSMVLDPNNQYTMYTGTNYMWKYDENTGNWSGDLGAQTLTNGNGRGNVINAIAVAPTDSNTIYTGSGDAGLFMTTNGGQSWRNLDQPIKLQINAINVSPAKANDFLVGFNGSGQPHLFHGVVTSGSLAFTPVSGSGSSGLPDASLNAIARDLDDPQNTWYVGTDVGVFMTTDAGASWSNAGTAFGLPPGIVNDLVAVPGTRYLNAGTYGRGLWRLYFPGNNAELQSLTVSPNPLVNRTSTTGTVTLNNPAPLGGMTLQLSGDNTLSFPSTVVVPYEVTTATFPITSSPTQTAVVSHITATEGSVSKTVAITVEPLGVQSLNAAPNDLVGGRESGGTVYLDGNAPSGGLTVKLSSNQASVKVPATIKIAAGTNAASFSITTVPVDRTINATITATTGEMTASTHVTVEAPSLVGMSIAPTLFVGGSATKVTGTLTFNGPSVAAGIPIQLTSSNPSAASVPATVTAIPTAANLAATFTVDHYVVQTGQSAVITASAQGQNSQTVTLGVLPFFLTGISVSPNSVVGGASSTGTVTLDGAPRLGRGDILVKLSTNSSAVTIPATVKVLDGKSSATFPITTKPVGATTLATITGAYGGITQTAQLTVQAPTLTKLSLSPTTIIGGRGHDVTATLVLNGVAPPGGVTVVCDGSPNSIISMPFLVTIPAGYTSTTFKITTAKVLDAATCTVYAQLGTTQLTATVKVEG